jgi:hypothetical protein
MAVDACTFRCLKATEPVKHSNAAFAEFHHCMTTCTQEDAREGARLQTARALEEARIQEHHRCASLAFELKRSIIYDQFIIPANQVVLPLLKVDQNDAAEKVVSQLYRNTWQSLVSGSAQFERDHPQCAAAREVFAVATHTLLKLKHELRFGMTKLGLVSLSYFFKSWDFGKKFYL